MNKNLKNIPKFGNEDEERNFWAKSDSTEYVNWENAKPLFFPKLKPSTKTISLRIPESMFDEIRTLANKLAIPYQSLIKIFLKDRIDQELKSTT